VEDKLFMEGQSLIQSFYLLLTRPPSQAGGGE